MAGISPKLPLSVTPSDGTYGLTKTVTEAITQDLKMILLTNPGERMMDTSFGVGLKRFLFEQGAQVTYEAISSKILQQVAIYLPQIKIEKILFNTNDDTEVDFIDANIVSMTIRFSIKPYNKIQTLAIPLL